MKSAFVSKLVSLLAIIFLLEIPNSFSQSSQSSYNQATVLFADFFTTKSDTITIENKLLLFEQIKVLNCLSGNIYFSGDGLSNNVIVLSCNDNLNRLKKAFERCSAGSKVILENCSFFRDGGLKPIVINKIITFK